MYCKPVRKKLWVMQNTDASRIYDIMEDSVCILD